MTYTASYNVSDVSPMVVDTLGGIFDAIATMANPVGITIMAIIALGLVVSIIAKLQKT